MSVKRLTFLFVFGVTIIFNSINLARADIYRYQDEQGVWHFTNIKSDIRYKLFFRTPGREPTEYIKEYESLIQQASERFSVDPFLVKAVIKAESDFDYQAVSSKGAQGLMQLMPETAYDMEVGDPFDPEENIFGGTRYLGLLLERYKNDKMKALAAYNAGPDRVEEYQGIPPFTETKDFIERVLKYYEAYLNGTE
jgi:soluble lytic murein transglycosylase-like protein